MLRIESALISQGDHSLNTIALVAHDKQKEALLSFSSRHSETLSKFRVMATNNTGSLLRSRLGWNVVTCGHGPSGGDVAIAAAVAVGEVSAVFFFVDRSAAHPHEVDVQALVRQCCIHDVPIALNLATATAVLNLISTKPLPQPRTHRLNEVISTRIA